METPKNIECRLMQSTACHRKCGERSWVARRKRVEVGAMDSKIVQGAWTVRVYKLGAYSSGDF